MKPLPLKALTLWPEWAWAIVHLGKRVENRTWKPFLPVGTTFAIHAGKHLGGKPGAASAREAEDDVFSMYGAQLPPGLRACPKSAIVCLATIAGYDQDDVTPWDVPGLWHWRLTDVRVLVEPVPCHGRQGLWTVDGSVERAVLRAAP